MAEARAFHNNVLKRNFIVDEGDVVRTQRDRVRLLPFARRFAVRDQRLRFPRLPLLPAVSCKRDRFTAATHAIVGIYVAGSFRPALENDAGRCKDRVRIRV